MMNFLRHACTAAYRVTALLLLLVIAAQLSEASQLLAGIFTLLYKTLGGLAT
jgi:hypothetical protein